MNRTEHLLTCLAEECAEVSQRVSKALRFGLDEIQKGQPADNAERIEEELRDLLSVVQILKRDGILHDPLPNYTHIAAKEAKINKFMVLAKEHGALE